MPSNTKTDGEPDRDNVANKLGDLLNLADSPPKRSPNLESKSAQDKRGAKKRSSDLASAVGLGLSDASVQDKRDNYKKNSPKASVSSPKKRPKQIVKKSKKRLSQSKNAPMLWLLFPELYPSVTESFRYLKSKTFVLERRKSLKTLMVTGPQQKVGVSTIAFNLALILAFDMIDRRILLVDTNLSNPSLHASFDQSINPGLMDYLFGIRPLSEIIRASDYPNLHLIPSGTIETLQVIPFDLKEFDYFLTEVCEQYDYIILDSAPALKSSQTQSLSSKTDGVIVVAEANKTRWQVMADLKQQLENDGANIIGSFLNKRRFPIPKWLYGRI